MALDDDDDDVLTWITVTSALLRVFQFNSCTRKQEYYARYASLTLTTNTAVKYCFFCFSAAIANFRRSGGGIFCNNRIDLINL